MAKVQSFKRGDHVFVCQVGFSGYGEWGVVRHRGRDMRGTLSNEWFIVSLGNKKQSLCFHESWLNRERPDAAQDNPLCRAA